MNCQMDRIFLNLGMRDLHEFVVVKIRNNIVRSIEVIYI